MEKSAENLEEAKKTEETKQAGKVLLEYESAMIAEIHKTVKKEDLTGNCFIVMAKGFTASKFIAALLYDKFSIKVQPASTESNDSKEKQTIMHKCSPYLIFIVNFQEHEF